MTELDLPNDPNVDISTVSLSESEWQDLRSLVRDAAGIKLTETKRVFLVSRLWKRLRATGTRTFREYFDLVSGFGCGGAEHQQLINAVTTNQTAFFREPEHFEVLTRWLSEPSADVRRARARGLRIWCAAASTGEEPYTIAAVLRSQLPKHEWSLVSITASDIDTKVLQTARRGIYEQSSVGNLDPTVVAQMFVVGNGEYRGKYRVRRELRKHVDFVQQNLVAPQWRVGGRFDVVFCRNVLIYFPRETQEQVVRGLLDRVEPHGLLILGAAESVAGLNIPVRPVAHSVYARPHAEALVRAARVDPVRRVQQFGCTDTIGPVSAVRVREPRDPAAPHGCRHWEKVEVGDLRERDAGWWFAHLRESLLIVLHAPNAHRSLVRHFGLEALDMRNRTLPNWLGSCIRQFPPDMGGGGLWAKILGASSREAFPEAEALMTDPALENLGVHIARIRSFACEAGVWIDASTGRVLVRADVSNAPVAAAGAAPQLAGPSRGRALDG